MTNNYDIIHFSCDFINIFSIFVHVFFSFFIVIYLFFILFYFILFFKIDACALFHLKANTLPH